MNDRSKQQLRLYTVAMNFQSPHRAHVLTLPALLRSEISARSISQIFAMRIKKKKPRRASAHKITTVRDITTHHTAVCKIFTVLSLVLRSVPPLYNRTTIHLYTRSDPHYPFNRLELVTPFALSSLLTHRSLQNTRLTKEDEEEKKVHSDVLHDTSIRPSLYISCTTLGRAPHKYLRAIGPPPPPPI